ncbi:AraC family transcriptional regulator [Aureibacter tunicatorum]|uniref:AraC family cel operon transcriptional repressor n=1 Tax=Aureibacter tunicatorum TaxID=866807 RepID=A0AAE4BSA1_9BACT|nr:AraC family transcriptional regulator [Aureibacter tunicatorum]MDR6239546.1 AraC family cel operon transcriptional repressor [Aureibacter tunicatorum]BDD04023.1 transcriptional regulator [Aureibacter tunicatorum]
MKAKIFKFETFINNSDDHFHLARTTIGADGDLLLHSHDYAEFFYVSSGKGIHLINGHENKIEQGSFCFIRPSDEHTFKPVGSEELVITNLALRWATVTNYQIRYFNGESMFWTNDLMPYQGSFTPDALRSVIKRVSLLINLPKNLLNLDLFVLHLFERLQLNMQGSHKWPAWLENALKEFRLPNQLQKGQKGFIELCERSSDHVNRVVKEHLGKTLTEMVNNERLNYVSSQLIMTNAPLKAIHNEAGFHNHSYFFRLFKKHYGMTPLEYREKHHKVF